jgi:hypothetical protein
MTMKNIIKAVFLSLILISTSAYGQMSRFGLKGGLNLSNMTVDNSSDKTLKAGFHVGTFGKFEITDVFAIQPEFLYSTKGFTNTYDNILAEGEAKFNLNYLEIPINVVYNLSEDFAFQLGPYIGFLTNANVNTSTEILNFFQIDSSDDLDTDNFNRLDFGLTAGLSFNLDQIIFGFNYNMGLTKVAKDNMPSQPLLGDARNTVIQIYAGIIF